MFYFSIVQTKNKRKINESDGALSKPNYYSCQTLSTNATTLVIYNGCKRRMHEWFLSHSWHWFVGLLSNNNNNHLWPIIVVDIGSTRLTRQCKRCSTKDEQYSHLIKGSFLANLILKWVSYKHPTFVNTPP